MTRRTAGIRLNGPHGTAVWRTPVMWCAAAGLLSVLAAVAVLTPWLVDGGWHPVAPRAYHISTGRKVFSWVFQGIVFLALVAVAVKVVRGCRRAREITFEAALYLGWLTGLWQAPLVNYREIMATQNRYMIHVASWGPYIPGWHGPHPEQQVETLFAASGLSYGMTIFWYWAADPAIGRIVGLRERWTRTRLVLVTLAVAVVASTAVETLYLQGGSYSYNHAIRSFSLFGGHWYQLPLTGVLIIALCLVTPMVAMKHWARIGGREIWAFQGSELLTRRGRTWARLLSGIGIANVAYLGYMVLNLPVSYAGGPPPADMPGYLRLLP
ncbi:spirocyclase AveC family protein [Streptomyces luteireticuli]